MSSFTWSAIILAVVCSLIFVWGLIDLLKSRPKKPKAWPPTIYYKMDIFYFGTLQSSYLFDDLGAVSHFLINEKSCRFTYRLTVIGVS